MQGVVRIAWWERGGGGGRGSSCVVGMLHRTRATFVAESDRASKRYYVGDLQASSCCCCFCCWVGTWWCVHVPQLGTTAAAAGRALPLRGHRTSPCTTSGRTSRCRAAPLLTSPKGDLAAALELEYTPRACSLELTVIRCDSLLAGGPAATPSALRRLRRAACGRAARYVGGCG